MKSHQVRWDDEHGVLTNLSKTRARFNLHIWAFSDVKQCDNVKQAKDLRHVLLWCKETPVSDIISLTPVIQSGRKPTVGEPSQEWPADQNYSSEKNPEEDLQASHVWAKVRGHDSTILKRLNKNDIHEFKEKVTDQVKVTRNDILCLFFLFDESVTNRTSQLWFNLPAGRAAAWMIWLERRASLLEDADARAVVSGVGWNN